ncbi:MAG: ABC transporter ATP-binding protein [Peptococcaceae bacterium]|nr:ABC transporter ATP-binding protein [Peptococcaceae bacterium]
MLKVDGLTVAVGGKIILRDINFEINAGETHILFGPNGSGKSTLLGTLMGFERFEIVDGHIYFQGEEITHLPVHERAQRGIGLMFQRPPTIKGLPMHHMIKICARGRKVSEDLTKKLKFDKFMDRDVNYGFSGGEMKRSEILQLLAQDPDLILLDEPESGVDIENIALIGDSINMLLERNVSPEDVKPMYRQRRERKKAGLIITHTGHILNYVHADFGHVIFEGRMSCHGNPRELFDCIQRMGYGECVRCAI